MNNISEYCIAEHNIRVVFTANDRNSPELIASFEPFKKKRLKDALLEKKNTTIFFLHYTWTTL